MTLWAVAWLPLLSSNEPTAHLFLIRWHLSKRLSKPHRHKKAHMQTAPTIHGKSKQELSGRSEPCLMQQDERCCRVVENWSLWSWQVGLNNNKLGETTSMNGQKEGGGKKRGKERQGRGGKIETETREWDNRKRRGYRERSEKSERQTEESGWRMKFWQTMTQIGIKETKRCVMKKSYVMTLCKQTVDREMSKTNKLQDSDKEKKWTAAHVDNEPVMWKQIKEYEIYKDHNMTTGRNTDRWYEIAVAGLRKCLKTWCISSGRAVLTGSAAVSPIRDSSEPRSASQPQHTLEQRNSKTIGFKEWSLFTSFHSFVEIKTNEVTFFENRDFCIAKERFGFLVVIDDHIVITLREKSQFS